jgi:hypothetical protein
MSSPADGGPGLSARHPCVDPLRVYAAHIVADDPSRSSAYSELTLVTVTIANDATTATASSDEGPLR